MAINFDSLAGRIFNILKSRGYTLKLYMDDGEVALDPSSEARKFFVVEESMMVSINQEGEYSEVKVYINDESDLEKLLPLLTSLRQTASVFNVLYNLKKYNKKLAPKEFAFLAYKVKKREKESDDALVERKDVSRMTGSNRSSYQKFGKPAKIIVRHSKKVDETIHGARSRAIDSLFIETASGERLKFPTKSLQGVRAMARHIAEGGSWDDDFGNVIRNEAIKIKEARNLIKMLPECEEKDKIKKYVRESGTFLKKIQGVKNYKNAKDNYVPDLGPDEEYLTEFKKRFNISEIHETVSGMVMRLFKPEADMNENYTFTEDESISDIVDLGAKVIEAVIEKYGDDNIDDEDDYLEFVSMLKDMTISYLYGKFGDKVNAETLENAFWEAYSDSGLYVKYDHYNTMVNDIIMKPEVKNAFKKNPANIIKKYGQVFENMNEMVMHTVRGGHMMMLDNFEDSLAKRAKRNKVFEKDLSIQDVESARKMYSRGILVRYEDDTGQGYYRYNGLEKVDRN